MVAVPMVVPVVAVHPHLVVALVGPGVTASQAVVVAAAVSPQFFEAPHILSKPAAVVVAVDRLNRVVAAPAVAVAA